LLQLLDELLDVGVVEVGGLADGAGAGPGGGGGPCSLLLLGSPDTSSSADVTSIDEAVLLDDE